MSLKLRKNDAGTLRPHWFGRYVKDGKRLEVSLCPWKGTPPASGLVKDRGNSEFEHSRIQAEEILENLKNQSRSTKAAEERHLLEEKQTRHLLKVKYGQAQATGTEIKTLWGKIAGELYTGRELTQYNEYTRIKIERFAAFMGKRFPRTQYLESVTTEELAAFLNYLEKNLHLTPRTWNDNLITLRAIFRKYVSYTKSYEWLRDLKRKPDNFISRELFSPEEIVEIIQKAAELDSEVKSMVIVASCTGLRLKDICLLEWSSIDFERNLITLKTHKTGGSVALGMWPFLRQELQELFSKTHENGIAAAQYVFPDVAERYLRNAGAMKKRLDRVLLALGYTTSNRKEIRNVKGKNKKQTLEKALAAIEQSVWTEGRKERVREIVTRYLDGETVPQLARELKVSKGAISMNLNALEELSGLRILRRIKLTGKTEETPEGRGRLNSEKKGRAIRASLRGWHSFRGSFVVAAIKAGVQMELIQKVLGSSLVEVIYQHYIKIDDNFMQEGFTSKAPSYALGETAPEQKTALPLKKAQTPEELKALAASILKDTPPERLAQALEQIKELLP
ncbi:MAG: site-specific integrase [Verrucomicrobia bacterium]|jgi:integrase|nr:site-specific integrase [Verrucomicrobiota bacterium]